MLVPKLEARLRLLWPHQHPVKPLRRIRQRRVIQKDGGVIVREDKIFCPVHQIHGRLNFQHRADLTFDPELKKTIG